MYGKIDSGGRQSATVGRRRLQKVVITLLVLAQCGTRDTRSEKLVLWRSHAICGCAHLPLHVPVRNMLQARESWAHDVFISLAPRSLLTCPAECLGLSCNLPVNAEVSSFPGACWLPTGSREIRSLLVAVQSASPLTALRILHYRFSTLDYVFGDSTC